MKDENFLQFFSFALRFLYFIYFYIFLQMFCFLYFRLSKRRFLNVKM